MDVCQKLYEKSHFSNKDETLVGRSQRAESLDVILVDDSASEAESRIAEP